MMPRDKNYKALQLSVAVIVSVVLWLFLVHFTGHASDNSKAITVALFPVLLLPVLFFFPAPVTTNTRFFAATSMVFGVLCIQYGLPVLAGPDAHAYFFNVSAYSTAELSKLASLDFEPSFMGLVSARLSFPLLIKMFLGDYFGLGPSVIAVLNVFFWIIASFLWVGTIAQSRFTRMLHDRTTTGLVFVLSLVSPSVTYWSSVFAKDIITTAITVFAATALFQRRYLVGIGFLIIATMLRPYAFVIGGAFFCFLAVPKKILWIALASSLAIVFVFSGWNIVPVINVPIMAGYFFMSPNPFNSANWQLWVDTGTWVLSPALFTVEGILISTCLIIGTRVAIQDKRYRDVYLRLGLCILICAAVLTLVGYEWQMALGRPYGVGVLGDNIVRKKLAVWPLIITWIGLSLMHVRRMFRTTRIKSLVEKDIKFRPPRPGLRR